MTFTNYVTLCNYIVESMKVHDPSLLLKLSLNECDLLIFCSFLQQTLKKQHQFKDNMWNYVDMTSLLIHSTSNHKRKNICAIATTYLFIYHSFFTKTQERQNVLLAHHWQRRVALLSHCYHIFKTKECNENIVSLFQ